MLVSLKVRCRCTSQLSPSTGVTTCACPATGKAKIPKSSAATFARVPGQLRLSAGQASFVRIFPLPFSFLVSGLLGKSRKVADGFWVRRADVAETGKPSLPDTRVDSPLRGNLPPEVDFQFEE
jgi:hypothetical protein